MIELLVEYGLLQNILQFCFSVGCLAAFGFILTSFVFNENNKNIELVAIFAGSAVLLFVIAACLAISWQSVLSGGNPDALKTLTQRAAIEGDNSDYRELVADCARLKHLAGDSGCEDKTLELMLKNVKEPDIVDSRSYAGLKSPYWNRTVVERKPLPTMAGVGFFIEDLALISAELDLDRKEAREKIKKLAPHLFDYYEKEVMRLVMQQLINYNVITHKNDTIFRYIVTELNLDCYGLTDKNCEKLRESARSALYKKSLVARELKDSITELADSLS